MTHKPYEYVTDLFSKVLHQISEINRKLFIEKAETESHPSTPRNYSIQAVYENSHANEKADGPEPTVRAILALPKTLNVDAETHERDKPWLKDRTFLLSIAGVIVGAAVAVVYCLQLTEMKHANQINSDALTRVQRPWVGTEDIPHIDVKRDDKGSVTFNTEVFIKNFGPSPALRLGWFMQPEKPRNSIAEYLDVQKADCKWADIMTNTKVDASYFGLVLYPNQASNVWDIRNTPDPQIVEIKPDDSFVIIGCMAYVDQFSSKAIAPYWILLPHLQHAG
jgi:hypothetical protein